ncbi:plasmid segregation actin-type ATPase ParM [Desulforamulus reducens MI-1]|uniref:Plasmid segregation actin-type ATPase ParM n=1 Tax=Desulforamulus reducens (strain ATCC BAA-1160 / DSM 100696 / MI-1) TaxID=349161 RepID=A4J353_DESRM|nr:ParM/StbA family protein [Desulforamulus reducens]ABO49506.1 plasmid segregation actin-type ATPase ParM [Desulforamulus reducens MI-1]
MSKVVAIDFGYREIKGVNSEGLEIKFPTAMAPYVKHPTAEGLEEVVTVTKPGYEPEMYFYGQKALDETGVGFTNDRDKHLHSGHDILMLAAARKLGYENGDTLVVGVPISYADQREALKTQLERLHGDVSVDGGKPKRISFNDVLVLRQGIVVFGLIPDLPNGTLISFDIGEHTTDVSTVKFKNGVIEPNPSKCFSLEYGYSKVVEAIQKEFQSKAGSPVSGEQARAIAEEGYVIYKLKKLDMTLEVLRAKEEIAKNIVKDAKKRLGEIADFAAGFYLCGGGADVLPLKELLPGAVIVDNPQTANARAYLQLAMSE